jgi:PTH1 family peptidyl-tRNA hydrolase
MKLIVGLGNPGKVYAHNRHNAGFRCLNYFARHHSIRFDRKQCRAKIAVGEAGGLLLAKPQTFVNISGEVVGCLVDKHNILLSDLLVICDDLDLPTGKVRIRQKGGSGGHKGMRSIISALGSEDFARIRVGIGRPAQDDEDSIVNYVLGNFSPQEEKVIMSAIITVSQAVDCFLVQGIEAAMSSFN